MKRLYHATIVSRSWLTSNVYVFLFLLIQSKFFSISTQRKKTWFFSGPIRNTRHLSQWENNFSITSNFQPYEYKQYASLFSSAWNRGLARVNNLLWCQHQIELDIFRRITPKMHHVWNSSLISFSLTLLHTCFFIIVSIDNIDFAHQMICIKNTISLRHSHIPRTLT